MLRKYKNHNNFETYKSPRTQNNPNTVNLKTHTNNMSNIYNNLICRAKINFRKLQAN